MPTNLLLLPLLGGYWFIHSFSYTRMRSQALDGYRLLLESAIAGLWFGIAARLIAFLLSRFLPGLERTWLEIAPHYDYLGTAIIAAALGVLSARPLNWFLESTGILRVEAARRRAVEQAGSRIHILLQTASNEERPVAFTLDNRKVYIGLVTGAPGLRPTDTSLTIIPFLSGYRETETMNLVFTVDYLRVYEEQQLDPREFQLAVPVSAIKTVGFFDPAVYAAFNVEADDGVEVPPA